MFTPKNRSEACPRPNVWDNQDDIVRPHMLRGLAHGRISYTHLPPRPALRRKVPKFQPKVQPLSPSFLNSSLFSSVPISISILASCMSTFHRISTRPPEALTAPIKLPARRPDPGIRIVASARSLRHQIDLVGCTGTHIRNAECESNPATPPGITQFLHRSGPRFERLRRAGTPEG